METPFSFSVPTKVKFGDGVSASIAHEIPKDAKCVVVIRGASGRASATVVSALRSSGFEPVEVACAGEPSVASINEALATLGGADVDTIVAVGGGSVIDSGKAVAFCLDRRITLPDDFTSLSPDLFVTPQAVSCIAVPTTAGTGAEVTANAVLDMPSQRAKVSLRGRALFPSSALVDPTLLPSAPGQTVLSSGLDALVQTIEAYTSCAATPFTDALSRPNIALGLRALKDVLKTGSSASWRNMAWVSLTSGVALANGGLGAAHGLASVLGGRYGAPHGALCGRLLVPVLRQNTRAAKPGSLAHRKLADVALEIESIFPALPGQDVFSGLEAWQNREGLPHLAALGVRQEEVESLAHQSSAASSSRKNAVELSASEYGDIIRAAL
ncbi:MAG: iron-containing alcohol dehydrogenase [Pseudomonadota bacterium]